MAERKVKLGNTVRTSRHGHRGVVYGIAMSSKSERWISILVDGRGAVSVPESDVDEILIIPPVYNGNPYYNEYFDML